VRRSHALAWLCAIGWVLSGAPRTVRAQTSDTTFAAGVRAYRSLEFDLAAWTLRRQLARLDAAGAPAAARVQGLVYLGAVELFRGQRDSAVAAFRRIVMLDPRYRPDQLVFPPEVTGLFNGVRLRTKSAMIVMPRDSEIVPGTAPARFRVVVSSFQLVDVSLRYEDGAPFRPLYGGPIGDSLEVQWDGFDAAGGLPAVSRLLLRVASRDPSGDLAGMVQLPLDVRLSRPDTLPWPSPPADSLLLPEHARSGPALRALMGGVLVSGAVAALPAVVGGSGTRSGPRMAVAGTIGFAGLLGYVLHRPGRTLAPNVRANQAVRDAWQRRVAAVTAENGRRRQDVRVVIQAGEPTAIQPRGL
jgi:hypothetical protein